MHTKTSQFVNNHWRATFNLTDRLISFRNERSASQAGPEEGALGPFDAAFAKCFDIRMNSSSASVAGSAARLEAEARAKQLETKLQERCVFSDFILLCFKQIFKSGLVEE